MTGCVSARYGVKRLFAGPPGLEQARVTRLLFALLGVIFVAEVVAARRAIVTRAVLLAFGAMYTPFITGEWRLETLLTCCFVHVSVLHVLLNLLLVREVGTLVETSAGAARFSVMYVASGIAGSVASTAWDLVQNESVPGAGASGAICGLIGAAMVVGWRVGGRESPLVRLMARWLVTVLVVGMLANFDNAAHAGGAAAGAMVALTWRRGPELPAGRTANVALFVIVLLASAGRLVQKNLTDPYATLTVDDRIGVAQAALKKGDCRDAWAAMNAARREAPRQKEVLEDVQIVRRACGGAVDDE